MENSVVVRARINPEIKEKATAVLSEMGLKVSDVIRMVLTKVAREGSLPFDAEEPNELTARVIEEGEKGINEHRAKDVSDLFKQLGL